MKIFREFKGEGRGYKFAGFSLRSILLIPIGSRGLVANQNEDDSTNA